MDIVYINITCDLGIEIDLNELADKIKEFNYTPDLFVSCGYLKDPKLKGKARIWKSGTINISSKNEKEAEEDLGYIIEKLRDSLGLEIIWGNADSKV